jgi:hypothetical protein
MNVTVHEFTPFVCIENHPPIAAEVDASGQNIFETASFHTPGLFGGATPRQMGVFPTFRTLNGAVAVQGPMAEQVAHIINIIFARMPLARQEAIEALQTGEKVRVQTGYDGQNSFSTLEHPSNVEFVYLNLNQLQHTSLEHLVLHEVFGHAFSNYPDARQSGQVGPNQFFLFHAYRSAGIPMPFPQPYGSFYG